MKKFYFLLCFLASSMALAGNKSNEQACQLFYRQKCPLACEEGLIYDFGSLVCPKNYFSYWGKECKSCDDPQDLYLDIINEKIAYKLKTLCPNRKILRRPCGSSSVIKCPEYISECPVNIPPVCCE